LAAIAAVGAALGGCVAEAPALSVAPGQGKSYADLQRDDAACRASVAPATAPSAAVTAPGSTAPVASGSNYYQCMQARGELIVANRPVPYPVYAGSYAPYYGYSYYGGPYYGYPYYGYPYYGYPYPATYVGPYVGIGIGFGFGGGYGHGWRDFDRGGRGFDRGGRDFGHGGAGHGSHR
jgi:hypothetical protein